MSPEELAEGLRLLESVGTEPDDLFRVRVDRPHPDSPEEYYEQPQIVRGGRWEADVRSPDTADLTVWALNHLPELLRDAQETADLRLKLRAANARWGNLVIEHLLDDVLDDGTPMIQALKWYAPETIDGLRDALGVK